MGYRKLLASRVKVVRKSITCGKLFRRWETGNPMSPVLWHCSANSLQVLHDTLQQILHDNLEIDRRQNYTKSIQKGFLRFHTLKIGWQIRIWNFQHDFLPWCIIFQVLCMQRTFPWPIGLLSLEARNVGGRFYDTYFCLTWLAMLKAQFNFVGPKFSRVFYHKSKKSQWIDCVIFGHSNHCICLSYKSSTRVYKFGKTMVVPKCSPGQNCNIRYTI